MPDRLSKAVDILASAGQLMKTSLSLNQPGNPTAIRAAIQQLLGKEPYQQQILDKYFPQMLFVKGGTFTMGCDSTLYARHDYDGDCWQDELPLHKVTLSDFEIGKYEITVAQYRLFCYATRTEMPSAAGWGWQEDAPIINVNWYDAMRYCNWLSREKMLTAVIDDSTFMIDSTAVGYRLPTEAEWEYAARSRRKAYIWAGTNQADSLEKYGWYIKNSQLRAHPVGKKEPNELGIYDMSGNVWEWCYDLYGEYDPKDIENPHGAKTGSFRVLRGGGWYDDAEDCRVVLRFSYSADDRSNYIGFRIALSL